MPVSRAALGNMLNMFRDGLVTIFPLIHSFHLDVDLRRKGRSLQGHSRGRRGGTWPGGTLRYVLINSGAARVCYNTRYRQEVFENRDKAGIREIYGKKSVRV